MKKIALMSLVASSILMAGGFKIPETSTNAVALGAANVAHNHNNADAAYYNPAKMVFMSNENHIEADLTYIKLKEVEYTGTYYGRGPYVNSSQSEDFYVPTLHYVSPKLGSSNARIGLSIESPAGLSKRWQSQPAQGTAQEFTLKTLEINPSVAFEVSDTVAFAVGLRIIKSSGVVQGTGLHPTLGIYSQDMNGKSVDLGYNLALAYKPTKELEVGVTYRSKINLDLEGNANLYSSAFNFVGGVPGAVSVPVPASLNAAIAYTFTSKTTLEAVFERTFWSAYKDLDFSYNHPLAEALFGKPKAKNWKDVTTYRIGLTQELDNMTLMAGLVIDNSPVPDGSLGYELPDTDTIAYSIGARYAISDKVDVALAGLYSKHDNRSIYNTALNGEFSDGDIVIISAGLGYKF